MCKHGCEFFFLRKTLNNNTTRTSYLDRACLSIIRAKLRKIEGKIERNLLV